ncbi:MAG: mannose-1-phosphate guanylyltransferase [Candidatus Caenarcaniphilales bacterium]|nr:mannose-1-phosphate guanylyltransferase [Candidatus Caenarcaniphilales bacterium]
MQKLVALILAGGSGTRLYPISTPEKPKQFLELASEELSLFQQCLERAQACPSVTNLAVITNYRHRYLADYQLRKLWRAYESAHIILETASKNTAPAITYASLLYPDATLLVLPSDHWISSQNSFNEHVQIALDYAMNGKIVLFGIKPSSPHSGYGYIQKGQALSDDAYQIASFKEKPDEFNAREYIKDGYLWNSGMFCFKSEVFRAEISKYSPKIYEACKKALHNSVLDLNLVTNLPIPEPESFLDCPSMSIDYAVMEKTEKAAVIESVFGWSDLGNWEMLNTLRSKLGLANI